MKILLISCLVVFSSLCAAQELYVFSEPASNRPAKSLALNITAKFPDSRSNSYFRNRYTPQLIAGINKNLTVTAGTSFSNYYRLDMLQFDGAKVNAKYRFLSTDKVHRHFRMAGFLEAGLSAHDYVYDEMGLDGDNDGLLAGLVATQLVNKFALSGTVSFLKVFVPNEDEHHYILNHSTKMVGYALSAGYLLLPKEYVDYKQVNMNLYLELLGSRCVDTKDYMIDLAPAVQLIFSSNTKLNIGARFQLRSNMFRVGENTLQVGLERTILNAWK